MEQVFDIAIIGGGINGCGCAADAALRGLSVVLIEQGDLASQTSSKSSQLIHGGLRYLEQLEIGLVKKSLDERQRLLKLAPHLVRPLPFVIPYLKNKRPWWMMSAGLFLYDHLSRSNALPKSKGIHRSLLDPYLSPLKQEIQKGFLFYDATTDDARLTISNALLAKAHGATILPHTTLTQAKVVQQTWHLSVQSNDRSVIKSKAVINATGPWVSTVSGLLAIPMIHSLSLVKGSHLVIKKRYEGEHAYLLQHDDQRIVFTIPYHGHTLIGTTEVPFTGNLHDPHITSEEIDYLSEIIHRYFQRPIHPSEILSTWSGVRPLVANPNKSAHTLSRDYLCHYSKVPAPAITVYGGKITTYRQLAKEAINQLKVVFPTLKKSMTEITPLPGGNLPTASFEDYQQQIAKTHAWLDPATRLRYLRSYGSNIDYLLAGCRQTSDLGLYFAPTLYQIEVDYLVQNEWATTAEDILWRRSKCGLVINSEALQRLNDYLASSRSSCARMPVTSATKACCTRSLKVD